LEKTEEGKEMMMAIELNEIEFTESVLSIDVSISSGKILLELLRISISSNFKNSRGKYDFISTLLLVKTDRIFSESKLGKHQDPEIWINNLKNLRVKLEDMGLIIEDDQLMIPVLNSLTDEYELQMIILEKRIINKENHKSFEELKEELKFRFERLFLRNNDE
jgi:hypothetical protein